MPKYLGNITEEAMFEKTKAALEERRYHEKILCADVLRAVSPDYDTLDRFKKNLVDWLVGTSAKYLGYERVRTTMPGVKMTYFYVYRGRDEPAPGQPIKYPNRKRRVVYDVIEDDPWLPLVERALAKHMIVDQTLCRDVYLALEPNYNHLEPREQSDVYVRVGRLASHLGYHRVRSSAGGNHGNFYRKFNPKVPRVRRSGLYPELYDRRGRPRI